MKQNVIWVLIIFTLFLYNMHSSSLCIKINKSEDIVVNKPLEQAIENIKSYVKDFNSLVINHDFEKQNYKEISSEITGYCACLKCCGKTNGITASGIKATSNHTIAMSLDYPFGTKVEIDGTIYTVEDRGGAIKGTKIDIYFSNHQEALVWGRQTKTVKLYKLV